MHETNMKRGAYHEKHVSIIHNCRTMKDAGERGKEAAETEVSLLQNDNKTQWSLIGIGLTLFFIQNAVFGGLHIEEVILVSAVFIGLFIFFKKKGEPITFDA